LRRFHTHYFCGRPQIEASRIAAEHAAFQDIRAYKAVQKFELVKILDAKILNEASAQFLPAAQ